MEDVKQLLSPGAFAKAAMDAVNVDLDEMRARVDSTHSIITSRQRVEVWPVEQIWLCAKIR